MAAEDELLERTSSLECSLLSRPGDGELLANGALAGVDCEPPIDGIAELKLFTFPDTWRLRRYHRTRIEESGERVRPDPQACLQGQQGVRKWEHGSVACWLQEGRSKAAIHWTDERTGTYGIIRPEAAANDRLAELWLDVLEASET